MPTYTYLCGHCGEFDLRQSILEPALVACPQCEGSVKRIITGGVGFIMKGEGTSGSHCENETPCCGRETRCDRPPCGK